MVGTRWTRTRSMPLSMPMQMQMTMTMPVLRAAAAAVCRPFHRSIATIATLPVDEATIGLRTDPSSTGDEAKRRLEEELAAAVRPYHETQTPLVVRGAVAHTQATERWSSLSYWKEVSDRHQQGGGDPMVAVEIGGSYGGAAGPEGGGDPSFQRAEIPFSAYLQFLELFRERHGSVGSLPGESAGGSGTLPPEVPPEELVYMAQNDLLPGLYPDVMVPAFCGGGENRAGDPAEGGLSVGLGRLYSVMVWLGPRGSVSPLHNDPLDNCFMQHAGRKRVLLFAPGAAVYAGHGGQQANTSPIDPEVLDRGPQSPGDSSSAPEALLRDYPLFLGEAPDRYECVLEPGDLLYIPARWWHHVRSIDASASVNAWWR